MLIILISLLSYLVINRISLFLPYYLLQQWQQECQLFNQNYFLHLLNKKNYLFLLLTCYFTVLTFLQQHSFYTTLAILIFNWALLCLSEIDWYYGLLPDQLTLLLMWCGLLINLKQLFTDSTSSILGAAIAYVSLWLFNQLFWICTKHQGMGHGDFKLFAAIGAWLGWQALPFIIISASASALFFSFYLSIKQKKLCRSLPFGPFLSFSAMSVMLSISHPNSWNFIL